MPSSLQYIYGLFALWSFWPLLLKTLGADTHTKFVHTKHFEIKLDGKQFLCGLLLKLSHFFLAVIRSTVAWSSVFLVFFPNYLVPNVSEFSDNRRKKLFFCRPLNKESNLIAVVENRKENDRIIKSVNVEKMFLFSTSSKAYTKKVFNVSNRF